MTLLLDTSPDGVGWLFGRWIAPDGAKIRAPIMPPVGDWNGKAVLEDHELHATVELFMFGSYTPLVFSWT